MTTRSGWPIARAALAGGDRRPLGAARRHDPVDAALWWRLRADAARATPGVALQQPAAPGLGGRGRSPGTARGLSARFRGTARRPRVCTGVPYGHFGDGCVHCRIDFPLGAGGGTQAYRRFIAGRGGPGRRTWGSMSGEHGDGRARSELLDRDVFAGRHRPVRRRQAAVRPRQPAQPGHSGRPCPAGRRPRGWPH